MSTPQPAATLANKPSGGTCKLCGHHTRTLHGLHIHLSTTHSMDWRKMKLADYLVEAPPEDAVSVMRVASSTSSRFKAISASSVGWVCPVCQAVHNPQALHCDVCASKAQQVHGHGGRRTA